MEKGGEDGQIVIGREKSGSGKKRSQLNKVQRKRRRSTNCSQGIITMGGPNLEWKGCGVKTFSKRERFRGDLRIPSNY